MQNPDFLEFFLSGKNRKICSFLNLDTFKKIEKYQKTELQQENLRREIDHEINKVKILTNKITTKSVQAPEPKQKPIIKIVPQPKYKSIREKFGKLSSDSKLLTISEVVFLNEIDRVVQQKLEPGLESEKEKFNNLIKKFSFHIISKFLKQRDIFPIDKNCDATTEEIAGFARMLAIKEFWDLFLSIKLFKPVSSDVFSYDRVFDSELSKVKSDEIVGKLEKFMDKLNVYVLDFHANVLREHIYNIYEASEQKNSIYDKLIGNVIFKSEIQRIIETNLGSFNEKITFNENIQKVSEKMFRELINGLTLEIDCKEEFIEQYKNLYVYESDESKNDDIGILVLYLHNKDYRELLLSVKLYDGKDADLSREEKLNKLWKELLKIKNILILKSIKDYQYEIGNSYRKTIQDERLKLKEMPNFIISEKDWLLYSPLLENNELIKKIVNFPGNNPELFIELMKIDKEIKDEKNITEVFNHAKQHYKVEFNPEIEDNLLSSLRILNGDIEMLKKILREVKTTDKSKFFIENGKTPELMGCIIEVWNYFWFRSKEELANILMLLGKNISTQKSVSATMTL